MVMWLAELRKKNLQFSISVGKPNVKWRCKLFKSLPRLQGKEHLPSPTTANRLEKSPQVSSEV